MIIIFFIEIIGICYYNLVIFIIHNMIARISRSNIIAP